LPPFASATHFFTNEAFAAPARGLPFVPIALDAQSDAMAEGAAVVVAVVAFCPNNTLVANRLLTALAMNSDDMVVVSF
jgi:hypothetical protein